MKKNLKKELAFIFAISLVVTGVFLVVQPTFASWAAELLIGIIGAVISGLGVVVGLVIEVLVRVAQYNNFTGATAIEKGWVVIRNLANMFFILVFLIIAFATILRVESYNYKKHLPKLLLMAVFINFSKTIAGLIIDFGQVAMITFVNGFKDIGAGNLIHMLGLTEILQLQEGADISDWSILAAYLLALLYMIVSLVTIVAILAVLIMRMVMLWIYVVLSPLAFLLAAFPGGKKYSEMWWSNFSKEVIVGPVLAFFIWLSFVTVSITTTGNDIVPMSGITDEMTREQIEEIQNSNDQISKAATSEVFIKFIISIGMLVGGLVVSKQIGATAGSAAGSALNTLNSGKNKVLGAGRSALRGGMRRAGRQAKTWGGDALDAVNMNPADAYKRYKSQLQSRRIKKKNENYKAHIDRASQGGLRGSMSMLMTGDRAFDEFKNHNFFKGMRTQKKLYRGAEDLKNKNEEISQTKEERNKYMSNSDIQQADIRLAEIDNENRQIDQDINDKKAQKSTGRKTITDENGMKTTVALSEDEKKSLGVEIKDLEDRKKVNNGEKIGIENKKNKLEHNDEEAAKIDNKIKDLESQKEKIDKDLKSYRSQHGSGFSLTEARVSAGAELEGEASKRISNVQNDGDLVEIIKEAIDRKDHAMIQAAYKKLAKTGNFNELNKALGLGTGHESMLKLAKEKFQGEAGMGEQESLALLGEVGDMAKSLGQFSAFGHTTMENGRWRETSQEEQSAAAFTESSKMQTQKWARDVTHLGLGSYQDGAEHDDDHFELNRDVVALLASKDSQYAKQIADTGNTNLINKLSANNNIEILEQNGAIEVAKELRKIQSGRKGVAHNNDVMGMLNAINLDGPRSDNSSETS